MNKCILFGIAQIMQILFAPSACNQKKFLNIYRSFTWLGNITLDWRHFSGVTKEQLAND